jgi:hypothetical protein
MRLPRVQFTLRHMMVALAVVALICWAGRLLLLSAIYHARAREFSIALMTETPIWMGPKERLRVYPAPSPRVRWAREMGHKYERAARCPWLPVEPDSPPPD